MSKGQKFYAKIKDLLPLLKKVFIDYYGKEYKDKGAKAYYKKNNISKDIEVDNNLDLTKIGSYKYTYSIKHKKQFK